MVPGNVLRFGWVGLGAGPDELFGPCMVIGLIWFSCDRGEE